MAQEYAKNEMVIKHGPYGSQCAENFSQTLEGSEGVKEVIIRHGFIVDAIGFVLAYPRAVSVPKMFGGNCGNESKIVLKCGEYITQISGTYGNYKHQCNQTVIASIKIHTNLCPTGYGPYGQGCGVQNVRSFTSPCPTKSSITGFFGRHNNYLQSIGVFMKKNEMVIKHGPYGSQCAENFSQTLEGSEGVKEVIIRHGFIVDAIGFVLAYPHTISVPKMFGGNCGNKSKIVLKCGEYITQISGTYGNYKHQCNQTVIASIKIHTNLCPTGYGPYGQGCDVQNVCSFSSPCPTEGPITGFFGRHNNYLESIGFFVKKESTSC